MPELTPESDQQADMIDRGPTNVLFDVWLASRATHALIDRAVAASGLDADEFAIYSVLASNTSLTPSVLAGWMAAPPTTVSSYVKRFERRGHVQRVPNPDDRRSYRLELTPAGREAHQAAGALFQPVLDEVESGLGTSVSDARDHLREIRRVLDDLTAD